MSKKQAFIALLAAFIESVKAGGPMGAPAGVMYAAVCDKINLDQFNAIMGALVQAGKIRKAGNVYHFVADL